MMMYRTRADYDNVLVNANPGAPALVDDFSGPNPKLRSTSGCWAIVDRAAYRQECLDGNAQSITPLASDNGTRRNQIVAADLRPTQFSGADRWIGLNARYVDENNYVYVTLRSSNTLQIKKLVHGAIQTLASMPFTVATNTTYRVRFEAVGSRLRAYVNGELKLEASDTAGSLGPQGAGIVMYKTAALVDNFSLFQP